MKTTITISALLLFISGSAFLVSAPPHKPRPLKLIIPKGWSAPSYNVFVNNPLTEEGFQLGKKLFYDGRLSKDGNVPCASCHQQFAAFATFDHDFSHGVNNQFSKRNAPALFNLAWMKEMHWDGGINHIEVQPLAPITNPNEMGETMASIILKIKDDNVYKSMFKAAFGDATINSQRILKALAQFTGSIQSYNSKYDKVKRGETVFTQSEQQGYEVYKIKCSSCHTEPLFTDNSFRNNGLDINPTIKDAGRMTITGKPEDSLKFKVPSLRNLYLTYPYMHDGRMLTLQQVLDHYRGGINTTQPTLDPLLKNGMAISKKEEVDLLAFLFTLTDETLSKNKRYAETITYKVHEGPH